jgi:hypothetical protein
MPEVDVYDYKTVMYNPYVDITSFNADYVLHITENITEVYYYAG